MTTLRTLPAALGLALLAIPARGDTGALLALGPDGAPLAAARCATPTSSAQVSGFVARVVVTQTFGNPLRASRSRPSTRFRSRSGRRGRDGDADGRPGDSRARSRSREDGAQIYEDAPCRGTARRPPRSGAAERLHPVARQPDAGRARQVAIEYVEPLAFEAGAFELSVPDGRRAALHPARGHAGHRMGADARHRRR